MSHDELSGMAAGYALSALDPDELNIFEAHLASCPECRANVAEMRPVANALSVMNEEAEPVEELRERILASARAEPRGPSPAERAKSEKTTPWWRRPVLWPLPVAAIITALAVAVAVVSIWMSQADDGLSSAQRRLGLTYEGLEIMAQADQWWRFDGSEITSGAAGTLAYSEEFGAACLLVWGLPEDDEFSYQARLTKAGGQVSVHKMWRYDNAMWLIPEGDPSLLQKLEVTLATGDSGTASEDPALIDIPLTSS